MNRQMRALPLDYFGTPASIREDGRVLYDLGLYRVKAETASASPWDYYERIGTISRDDPFLPIAPNRVEKK